LHSKVKVDPQIPITFGCLGRSLICGQTSQSRKHFPGQVWLPTSPCSSTLSIPWAPVSFPT
jgi:hypothetical protein